MWLAGPTTRGAGGAGGTRGGVGGGAGGAGTLGSLSASSAFGGSCGVPSVAFSGALAKFFERRVAQGVKRGAGRHVVLFVIIGIIDTAAVAGVVSTAEVAGVVGTAEVAGIVGTAAVAGIADTTGVTNIVMFVVRGLVVPFSRDRRVGVVAVVLIIVAVRSRG